MSDIEKLRKLARDLADGQGLPVSAKRHLRLAALPWVEMREAIRDMEASGYVGPSPEEVAALLKDPP